MIRITLSTKLGELRWTQADLARATGIRANTISDYYNELTERVNLDYLDLICEAMRKQRRITEYNDLRDRVTSSGS